MNSQQRKRDRLLTGTVITVAVLGILFFGYQSIRDNARRPTVNPYEYSVKPFDRVIESQISHSETASLPVDLPEVYGLALDASGHIYVSGEKEILRMDAEGKILGRIPVQGTVNCLAVTVSGDLYLGFGDHIEVFDSTGRKKAAWDPPGERSILTSVALWKDTVYAADAGHAIVWKYDMSGQDPVRIGNQDPEKDIPGFLIPSPFFDVAVDPDGFLWAANTGRHQLESYNPDGGFRTSWGEASMDIEGFCGCCNPSHFAVLPDGSFVTSEKGIPRVKIYDRLGRLASVVAGPDRFDEGTKGLDTASDAAGRIYILDPSRKRVRIFSEKKRDNE